MFPGHCVLHEELTQLVRDRPGRAVVLARVARDKEVAERGDLIAPLTCSAGHDQLDDLETIVEVLAELAVHHHLFEIAVRRGDDADVDLNALVAAQLREFAVLQHVEELGLQRRLHLADFVEHQRTGVGLLELADPRRRGAGKGSTFVAEELALEQLGREAPRS